jgi:hypothetical protein
MPQCYSKDVLAILEQIRLADALDGESLVISIREACDSDKPLLACELATVLRSLGFPLVQELQDVITDTLTNSNDKTLARYVMQAINEGEPRQQSPREIASNSLMMSCQNGDTEVGMSILRLMEHTTDAKPDLIQYEKMLEVTAASGNYRLAVEIFKRMRSGRSTVLTFRPYLLLLQAARQEMDALQDFAAISGHTAFEEKYGSFLLDILADIKEKDLDGNEGLADLVKHIYGILAPSETPKYVQRLASMGLTASSSAIPKAIAAAGRDGDLSSDDTLYRSVANLNSTSTTKKIFTELIACATNVSAWAKAVMYLHEASFALGSLEISWYHRTIVCCLDSSQFEVAITLFKELQRRIREERVIDDVFYQQSLAEVRNIMPIES